MAESGFRAGLPRPEFAHQAAATSAVAGSREGAAESSSRALQHAAERTAATELRGAEQASAAPAASREGARRENTRSLTAARPLDGEFHSAVKRLAVDHYFRSARRRPTRVTEHETYFSNVRRCFGAYEWLVEELLWIEIGPRIT